MDKIYIRRKNYVNEWKRKRYNYTIKYNIEMKYTEYKGENCIYYKRKLLHDMKML